MTSAPLTDQQTDEIETAINDFQQHPDIGFACCSAHPAADAATALLAEVRRLRAELDTEKQAHLFTLRQRNNRSNRLILLRDLALAGDTAALLAASKDTLAASRTDHDACHSAAATP